jgi:hypothetical protein
VEAITEPTADALLEDYKLKVAFATEQINRLQTQFQVMLSLEAAVATALVVSNSGSLSKGAKWIALLELGLSFAWLMVGWVGRERALVHRSDLEDAGRAWASVAGLGPTYRPVGAGPPVVRVAVVGPCVLIAGWAALFIVFLLSD